MRVRFRPAPALLLLGLLLAGCTRAPITPPPKAESGPPKPEQPEPTAAAKLPTVTIEVKGMS